MTIIYLEGTEKSGKSNLAKALFRKYENILPVSTELLKKRIEYCNFEPNTLFTTEYLIMKVIELYSTELLYNKNINSYIGLLDRGPISGIIYNKMFKRFNKLINLKTVLKFIENNGLIIVYLRFDSINELKRRYNIGGDALIKKASVAYEIQKKYDEFFSKNKLDIVMKESVETFDFEDFCYRLQLILKERFSEKLKFQ